MSTRCEIGYTFVYKVGQCLGVCLVGVAEKITGNGNVDTINSTRHVGTVSLMLFSNFLLVQNGVIVDLVQNWYNVYLVQMWYNELLGGFAMTKWKTMREVAQELGVSKRVIKYHKEKLGLFEATLENGVIKISPQGVEKIKGFVRPKEYTQNFETEVLQRLEAIEELLATDDFDKRDPKEVIRSFWQYLIATPNAAEILEELVGDVVTLEPEQDFYRETARLVNLENGISELPLFGDGSDIFDSDWP